jgi:2-polyprenyl-3-methyl-5-hydroxy-6-metoxy-1,4-benzoquinol methylase
MTGLWRSASESYGELPIRCAPGVHSASLALVTRHAPISSRVLDLASGSGAFLLRLKDAGFRDLTAVERSGSGYLYPEAPLVLADLDQPFALKMDGTFDLVTALEIIEHLGSPVTFLQEIRKLLRPSGLVLISTPNVTEWQSRVKFMIKGQLRYFDEHQHAYQRHISPILPDLVRPMFQEAALTVISVTTAGSFDGPLRRRLLGAPMSALAKISGAQHLVGECLIILAQAAPHGA